MKYTYYYNSETHETIVISRDTLLEIKYAAQELIKLDDSIQKAQEQIEQHPTKESYIDTRLHAIQIWKEQIEEHHKNLTEAFTHLTG
jgi:chromosome segregation ATPase